MAKQPSAITLQGPALDILMPMHLVITLTGHISHAGAMFSKLFPNDEIVGRRFLEVFLIRRPRRDFVHFEDLKAVVGRKLRLSFRAGFPHALKGVMVQAEANGCLLLNMSFGYSLPEAVQNFALTNGDFSQTEMAIEMLYLLEAKSALMDESRKLNMRLHGARLAAEEQASTDALTGLNNRRAMDKVLSQLTRNGREFGLMHVDLDYFKAVNDTMGHAAGDHVLKAAASVLRDAIRQGDTVARVGGDEFVLVFEGLVDKKQLMDIGNRIVEHLGIPVDFEGKVCRISGSIGVATSTFYREPNLDQMLSDVDVALYESKHRGRSCTTMVTPELLAKAGSDTSPLVGDPN